ncbi:Hypothetical Protein PANA_3488 [Pantoea ananatis LMG 20103]|uniref:Uncharacterized protein n=1 Tax=Pantoea ananatis (strain LMG 20103) TaxID=706191 RepID=D4GNV0_PANAM|nr:Hypothetical Protein PANA_3488 [Pantoea ananatis LMG 20103]
MSVPLRVGKLVVLRHFKVDRKQPGFFWWQIAKQVHHLLCQRHRLFGNFVKQLSLNLWQTLAGDGSQCHCPHVRSQHLYLHGIRLDGPLGKKHLNLRHHAIRQGLNPLLFVL